MIEDIDLREENFSTDDEVAAAGSFCGVIFGQFYKGIENADPPKQEVH